MALSVRIDENRQRQMRNANWSFRLRLHSGLRQSGSRFAVAFYGPTEVGPFRVRSVASDEGRDLRKQVKSSFGSAWWAKVTALLLGRAVYSVLDFNCCHFRCVRLSFIVDCSLLCAGSVCVFADGSGINW